ncbi:hypothetical protein XAP412_180003 [Xanthomonas phaseoli pv. phaseoli]|uniref:Uncharacterized protein n=1 Tax=Xanthomonas campestris pv. phaseoli TaxID=317013 RepID=A0AB38DXI8_XANCH|nr:hypothetical protein XAP412_180003 [Xanthomonas phaseoli pv. phaseoli]SON85277.1 hypothetical protein XAP7430_200003 [Xanthomonas phaseoli pv. phaseoli]SOO31697.1 hypothetical protein XAP6164_5810004 [Xanthomonas phaseoli pv. phaseoli]
MFRASLEKFYIDRRTLPDRVATLARFIVPTRLPDYIAGQFYAAFKTSNSRTVGVNK